MARESNAEHRQRTQGDEGHGDPPTRGIHVAVIGTGTMGAAMVRRLRSQGAEVDVWNRNRHRADELAAFGANVHRDPRDAVSGATVVVTMLPTGDVVRAVMIDGGVVGAMAAGAVWAQMGTIGLEATDALVGAVSGMRGVRFVDAPVSGSRVPAEAGQLVVLASGPEEARPVADPVFAVLGHRTLWLGPAGAGSRMKLVLNTWLAFEVEAAAEASALATRLGITADVLSEAVAGSPLVSPFAATKLAKMQSADDGADFSLGWALKDLRLAQSAATPGVVPVAAAIARRWEDLADRGFGDLDVSAARHGLE